MTTICNDNKISIKKNNKLFFFYHPVIETSNGKLYQLICYVYAINKPKIIWKTIDTFIINDLRYKIILNDLGNNHYICTLEIIKVPDEKNKEIHCVIKNDDGTIYSTFNLHFLGHYKPINILHGDLCIHNNFKKISFEHYFTTSELTTISFFGFQMNKQQDKITSFKHLFKNIHSNCWLSCITLQFIDLPKENMLFYSIIKNMDDKIIRAKCFIVIPKDNIPILLKSFQFLSPRSDIFEINLHVKYLSKSYPSVRWFGKRGQLIVAGDMITILNHKCAQINEYETILKIRSSFGSENNIYYCLVQNLSGYFNVSFTCNY
ncbi:Immunoglobulin-like fold domain-containing protein [Strongyloides ratti]|uniref:Immunoglobulin-like fold domain-containing protein n=1 Tax=Strongyloides ratti TaxID=34506 RepID=A0A090L4I4_STRRB|nr:Immunoglobulin-like fold domain-containing protein [Strongyloides ratti]CEF64681.1 Immunoglobulin-like fold domain-containing protein [Strongyloides ratti]